MVVRHFETTVLEKAHERILLAHAVAERRAQKATLVLHPLVGILGEREERGDVGPEMAITQCLALVGTVILPGPFELEHAHDAGETLARDRVLRRDSGFPQLGPCVTPAPDLCLLYTSDAADERSS